MLFLQTVMLEDLLPENLKKNRVGAILERQTQR